MKIFFQKNGLWLWPLIFLLVITPFTPFIDQALTQYFYEKNHFAAGPFFVFIFKYGFYPADITVGIAVIVFFGSFLYAPWKKWRSGSLVLILTLAIGAGLIIHGILKDHWGRPRPKQVIEFGGHQVFRPYYQPNFFHQPEPSKSFPSGHSSVGFFFFSLALVGREEKSKVLFWTGMILAFGLGLLLSYTRIAQGGHFFSDTLISCLIMWWTALSCTYLVYSFGKKSSAGA